MELLRDLGFKKIQWFALYVYDNYTHNRLFSCMLHGCTGPVQIGLKQDRDKDMMNDGVQIIQ